MFRYLTREAEYRAMCVLDTSSFRIRRLLPGNKGVPAGQLGTEGKDFSQFLHHVEDHKAVH